MGTHHCQPEASQLSAPDCVLMTSGSKSDHSCPGRGDPPPPPLRRGGEWQVGGHFVSDHLKESQTDTQAKAVKRTIAGAGARSVHAISVAVTAIAAPSVRYRRRSPPDGNKRRSSAFTSV